MYLNVSAMKLYESNLKKYDSKITEYLIPYIFLVLLFYTITFFKNSIKNLNQFCK